ncbi:MAG TPA: helix-turn-helix domain-containing protein [Granulicella sp.]|jgi:hypothetical protein
MRFVLLALADHADQSGFAFPSVARIAERCVLTARSVIGALQQLQHESWITKTRKGKASQYQINLEKLGIGAALGEKASGEIDEQTSRENASREIHCSPQVKSTAPIGEIHCKPPAPPYRSNRHEPPVEPSVGAVLFPVEAKQPRKIPVDLTAYVDFWNERRGPLAEVQKLTPQRQKRLAARIAEGFTLHRLEDVLAKIHATPFLLGDNDRGWRVSFNFVMASDDHITDILEGTYDRASKPKPVRTEMPSIGEDSHAAR